MARRRTISAVLYCLLILSGAWAAIQRLAPLLREILSAPGYLDDAATWQREWLPIISEALTWIDLWLQTQGYLILLSVAAGSLFFIHGYPRFVGFIRGHGVCPFTVEFATEMPDLDTASNYVYRYELLVEGKQKDIRLSGNKCRFSIRNQHTTTAQNVTAFVITINGHDLADAIELPYLGSTKNPLTVHPGEPAHFQFLEFVEPRPAGYWSGLVYVDERSFDLLSVMSRPDVYTPMAISMGIPRLRGSPIQAPLKNERMQIDIVIYSENNPAVYLNFEITRPDRIVVSLLGYGLNLPKGTSAGNR